MHAELRIRLPGTTVSEPSQATVASLNGSPGRISVSVATTAPLPSRKTYVPPESVTVAHRPRAEEGERAPATVLVDDGLPDAVRVTGRIALLNARADEREAAVPLQGRQ